MNIVERLKLNGELSNAIKTRNVEKEMLKRLALIQKIQELRQQLGLIKAPQSGTSAPLPNESKTEASNDIVLENLTELVLPETFTRSAVSKVLYAWLKENVQGKFITTSDGLKVRFNANHSMKHLVHDGRIGEIEAKAITHIADVFATGKALGRQELNKERSDFVAFYAYQKEVVINDIKCLLEAKAGEHIDGSLESLPNLVAYSQRIYEKTAITSLQSIEDENVQAGSSVNNGLVADNTLSAESGQEDFATLTILSITDLNGNPINLEEPKSDNEITLENLTELELPENASQAEKRQAVTNWIKENWLNYTNDQLKFIITSDNKKVYFNSNASLKKTVSNASRFTKDWTDNLSFKAVTKIPEVFSSGAFVGVESLTKERKDDFVAFHVYRKIVEIDSRSVELEVKAGERSDGKLEVCGTLIGYSFKMNESVSSSPVSSSADTKSGGSATTLDSLSSPTSSKIGTGTGEKTTVSDNHTLALDNVQDEDDYDDYLVKILHVWDKDGKEIFLNDEPEAVTLQDLFNYNDKQTSTKTQRQNSSRNCESVARYARAFCTGRN